MRIYFIKLERFLKYFILRIFLAIFITISSLFIIELSLRFYSSRQPSIIFQMSDSEIIYKLTPNSQGMFSDVPIKINSQGFRQNNDVSSNKPQNMTRIIGLGDSVAFGFGVEEEKTYLRKLENTLNASSSAHKYEIINAGVSGYNTLQERKLLEGDLLKFEPDVIILSFVLNDIAGEFNVPNMVHRTLAPFKSGSYSLEDLNPLEKKFYSLFQERYLYQFIHPYLKNLWGFKNLVPDQIIGNYSKDTIEFYQKGYYRQKQYAQSVPTTEAELLKISDLAKKNGSDLIIVIFPVGVQLEDQTLRKPQENLMKFCQNNSLKCFDLISALEKEKDKKLFNDGIGHPNEYASEIIAKAIHEYLIKNKIVTGNEI